MPRFLSILALMALALVVSDEAPATKAGSRSGELVRAVSGDTLDVRIAGRVERVRLLGVVAPTAGSCYSRGSAAAVRALVSSRRLTLTPQGRAAYVSAAGRGDLGRLLLARGAVQIDSWGSGFARLDAYVPVQRAAELANRGMWGACAADVAVALEAPEDARVGADVEYVARVSNLGALPASNVGLELRPPGSAAFASVGRTCAAQSWIATCSLGTIPSGGTVTVKFLVRLTSPGLASTRVAARFTACLRSACARRSIHDSNLENDSTAALTTVTTGEPGSDASAGCHPSYPTVCIPHLPPDLNCADIPFRKFRVLRTISDPDPHDLDGNRDGVGCTFDDY